jgi:copper chaperone CopZ
MKTLKIFIALFIITISAAKAQFIKADLQVSGLTCSMCSKATEKSLRTLNFIGDIKVDLNKNVFVITFKKDVPVNVDQISKKVQNAGFFVNSLKATFDFDNVKLSDNAFTYGGDTYKIVSGSDKTLTGPVAVTVVDKGFLSSGAYKKYSGLGSDKAGTGRVYHIAI